MARSKAHENLHKLSPILYDTLVHLDLMPYRELTTPEELKTALQGGDRLLIDATERAYHRSHDVAKQRFLATFGDATLWNISWCFIVMPNISTDVSP